MSDFSAFMALALRVLSERLLCILALLMTFGLFCWSMWMQTVLSAVIASTFGGVIFLPVLFSSRSRSAHAEDQ